MVDTDGYWICARTRFNQEISIREMLEKEDVQYFIPTCRKIQKFKTCLRETEKAVIPNLIFFKTSWSKAFSLLTLSGGKMNYIRLRDKKILTIPEDQMDAFMRLIDEMKEQVVILPECYALGDRVVIKSGNLAGMEG
ncbi:MAG: transcription termination/antitermination NusG family protein, partial [Rikenellaceae bacterium]